ncbi:hypothetical protein K1719_001082 [Acacia pycnantha]|nr:hypothetical protein K1719_001082 [Acacia pycnantha]
MFSGKKEGLAKEPKWLYPKCHRQAGHTECGYYVILYMFNIIQSGQTTNLEQIFGTEAARTWTGKYFLGSRDLQEPFHLQCWDYLNDPRESESLQPPEMHHGMEVSLGLSNGPVVPSFR